MTNVMHYFENACQKLIVSSMSNKSLPVPKWG